MRSVGIEIEIDTSLIPQGILNSGILDIEFSSKENCNICWIHSDGYKPFLQEHFQYLGAAISVYNRVTGTDHLNLYVETSEDIDEYGENISGVKHKNIRFSELGSVNLPDVKFKRDLLT